jgi:hypothetical protein
VQGLWRSGVGGVQIGLNFGVKPRLRADAVPRAPGPTQCPGAARSGKHHCAVSTALNPWRYPVRYF